MKGLNHNIGEQRVLRSYSIVINNVTILSEYKIYPSCVFGFIEITDLKPSGKLFWFTHDNGRLNATRSGYYYIYAQAFFERYPEAGYWHNRVHLMVNGHREGLLQAPLQGKGTSGLRVDYGNVFTAIITRLQKGDVIHLKTQSPCNLWMGRGHTFFGAFKLR